MARLIPCPLCQAQIAADAYYCVRCKRNLPRSETPPSPPSRGARLALLVFGLAALVFVGGVIAISIDPDFGLSTEQRARMAQIRAAAERDRAEQAKRDRRDAEEWVARAQRDGVLLRHDCRAGEAYITPIAWHTANIDQKRAIARMVGLACNRRIHLRDSMSGRTLGYGSATSVTIE